MPIFLYGVGALTFAVGIAAIGYGIPNNEFGIGNTLIVSGMTAAGSGLILIGLGVVVAQLQRIADALGTRAAVRTSRPFETFEPAAAAQPQPGQARVPFPPRTKPESPKPESPQEIRPEPRQDARPEFRPEPIAEAGSRDPFAPEPRKEPAAAVYNDRPVDYFAPSLPNPDEPPETAADEVYLSPLHPAAPSPPSPPAFFRTPDANADRRGPAETSDRRGPVESADRDEPAPPRAPNTYFDTMWPSEPKSAEPKPAAQKPSELHWPDIRRGEQAPGNAKLAGKPAPTDDLRETATNRQPDEVAEPAGNAGARSVAILKSGVVDGMGYTLYVDGSIEAELPQGTLRFASINELRSHLEKSV